MLTHFALATVLDTGIGQALGSPFIVPVAGCAMIGSIAVAGIWSGVRTREIRSHERLARIAQGLPVEPDWDQETLQQAKASSTSAPKPFGRPNDGAGAHRAGLILCSIGIGLIAFFAFLAVVLRERDVFSGACAGIPPLAIGAGFLVDARSRRKNFDRWMATVRPGEEPRSPFPDAAPGAPPPPPMTPAQASDWRPLH